MNKHVLPISIISEWFEF